MQQLHSGASDSEITISAFNMKWLVMVKINLEFTIPTFQDYYTFIYFKE